MSIARPSLQGQVWHHAHTHHLGETSTDYANDNYEYQVVFNIKTKPFAIIAKYMHQLRVSRTMQAKHYEQEQNDINQTKSTQVFIVMAHMNAK